MVAAPSPLVSPPTLSSSTEVNTTGLASVPATTRLPDTSKPALLLSNFTTTPAGTDNVTPDGTEMLLSTTKTSAISKPHSVFVVMSSEI